ncbi:uncharacterized protein EDB91DRAFT_1256566 [Suillus paluster]|uniref:uncharacterized protein n=1 Tax=Suillus paluster TaxID=48578 RepID=UPI001B87E846|nr:uncharacterized protein EDB91DRAFT_1256566 [Suillus paluster]KAG1721311.1 hypothetical protein EDB91DRAFT_1256566 [Suillus paluster]
MYGSQISQRRPSGAPGFSVPNHVSQERQHTMVGDIPYNFRSDQSHLSPLTPMTPALPQLDGGPREQTGTSGDASNGLMQNQHNQVGTGRAGQMSSPEFSRPFGLPHEHQTPSHPMRAPSVPNFTPSSQGRSPYLGHDSRTSFSNSEPSSRGQSLGPGMEYNQLLYPRQQQQQQVSTRGFSRPLLFQEPAGYRSDDLQNHFSQLAAEHVRLQQEHQLLRAE